MSIDYNPFKTQKDFDDYVSKLVDKGIIQSNFIDIDLLMKFLQDSHERSIFTWFMPILFENGVDLLDYVTTKIPANFVVTTSYPCDLKKLVIPEGIKIIGKSSLSYNNYREIVFPSSLEIIEKWAFEATYNLSKLDLSNTHCKIIDEGAFSRGIGDSALTKIQFPTSLERIGEGCFYSSFIGESLEFNEGLKDIESAAFENSNNLSEVTLCTTLDTDTLDRIWDCRAGYYIFRGCSNLKTI